MLQRLRRRAIDGAANLVRLLDARREIDGLREAVEHLVGERDDAIRERDEYARLVATRAVEIDELLRLRREIEAMETTGAVLAAQEAQFDPVSGTVEISRRAAMQIGFWHRKELAEATAEAARLQRELDHTHDLLDAAERQRDAAKAERDARIPIDIDGAARWLHARGWWFEREDSSPLEEPWSAYRDTAAQPVLVADTYWRAVLQSLGEELSEAWDSAPSPEPDNRNTQGEGRASPAYRRRP